MDKMRDLVESVAVALLSVRNSRGERVIIPNPKRYAEMIAEDLRLNPPQKPKRALRPAPEATVVRTRVTWMDPALMDCDGAMPGTKLS